jgi:hypothetical protein
VGDVLRPPNAAGPNDDDDGGADSRVLLPGRLRVRHGFGVVVVAPGI